MKLTAGLLGIALVCAVGLAALTVIVTEAIARASGSSGSSFWTAVTVGLVSVFVLLGGAFLLRR